LNSIYTNGFLSDIASNVAETEDDLLYARDIIIQRCRQGRSRRRCEPGICQRERQPKVKGSKECLWCVHVALKVNLNNDIMQSASRVHCNIAFGELVVNFPEVHVANAIYTLMPALIDVLRDVPYIDFDKCLSWEGESVFSSSCCLTHISLSEWALPDQLVFSTVSALLRISGSHEKYSEAATTAIFSFISRIVDKINTGSSLDILTQLTPALHGLYRAISSTSFQWTIAQWQQLAYHMGGLCVPHVVDRLNHLVMTSFKRRAQTQILCISSRHSFLDMCLVAGPSAVISFAALSRATGPSSPKPWCRQTLQITVLLTRQLLRTRRGCP
ncbi:hypothetical protein B0H10DRAFT_2348616, partial [Mycena sp. CBHHK59/15]